MRVPVPHLLPVFRSEMQVRLLALLLLQPERAWTLADLAEILEAPPSSVHRELSRAERAGLIVRDDTARSHRFRGATDDAVAAALAALLGSVLGVEQGLVERLRRPDVDAAVIHGSWAGGGRRPGSDVDVLVVGEAPLADLRRAVRPVGKAVGRTIDLTVLTRAELRDLDVAGASFVRRLRERPVVPLVGDLDSVLSA